MLDYLKVKVLSLTEEAKIIRNFENSCLRKAAYARRMAFLDRQIAFHTKEIARLKNAHNGSKGDPLNIQGRICAHELELKVLARQHNNTKVVPAHVEDHFNRYWGMHQHRIFDIRKEARTAQLAYGFLKGKPFREIENRSYSQPNWDRIEKLAIRYGEVDPDLIKQAFAEWKREALAGMKETYLPSLVPGSVRKHNEFKMR